MYIFCDDNNVAFCASTTRGEQENGNPLVHDGTLAIAAVLVAHEYAADVPEDYADGKYCYDGTAWTPNPDYAEPVEPPAEPTLEERVTNCEQAIEAIITEDTGVTT